MTHFRPLGMPALALAVALSLGACGEKKAKDEKNKPAQDQIAAPEEIPKGDAGRRMYFELLCDKGHGGMCAELALMHQKGWGGKKDKKEAKRIYQKACDLGTAHGCEEVGKKLSWQDELKIHKVQCEEKNNPVACNNYGHLLWIGKEIEHDFPKAREAIIKGCEGGFSKSCRAAVRLFGKGIGGERDEEKAKEYAEKAKKAFDAEQELEAKYLHRPSKNELPVGVAPASWGKRKQAADAGPRTEPEVY